MERNLVHPGLLIQKRKNNFFLEKHCTLPWGQVPFGLLLQPVTVVIKSAMHFTNVTGPLIWVLTIHELGPRPHKYNLHGYDAADFTCSSLQSLQATTLKLIGHPVLNHMSVGTCPRNITGSQGEISGAWSEGV